MRTGKLEAFFETGTEGVVWSVYEDGKHGYDALNCLRDGDYLRVFNPEGNVVFDGEIDLEWKRNYRPYPMNPSLGQQEVNGFWVRGLQVNVEPEEWSNWFHTQYRCEFDIIERCRPMLRVLPSPNGSLEKEINAALDTLEARMMVETRDAVLTDIAQSWKWDTENIHPFFVEGFNIDIPARLMSRVESLSKSYGLEPNVLLEHVISRYIPTQIVGSDA